MSGDDATAQRATAEEHSDEARQRRIAEAAERAAQEAEERRKAKSAAGNEAVSGDGATERGGPKGPEPTRYGDWEKKGLISDF